MYPEYTYFALAVVAAIVAGLLLWYLLLSRRNSRIYRDLIDQEMEFYSKLTTSLLTHAALSTEDPDATVLIPSSVAPTVLDPDLTKVLPQYAWTSGTVGIAPAAVFSPDVLRKRYVITEEIHGGGLSRAFLAKHAQLGNEYFVKFIPHEYGSLLREAEFLMAMYHPGLPRINDIFEDEQGYYLVETYIEGSSLEAVLATDNELLFEGDQLRQVVVLDWAEQLARILAYMHRGQNPDYLPLYHLDLKPANIMVTHDHRLVVIDFGVSKRWEESHAQLGVTYEYAAPEQLKHEIPSHYEDLVARTFGKLPEARHQWELDARTDIYSLGVILFRLATGVLPTQHNRGLLEHSVTQDVAHIVMQCLELDPMKRFQSVDDLLVALQKVRMSRNKMLTALERRRTAIASCAAFLFISAGSAGWGGYVFQQESLASVLLQPDAITLSVSQSSEMKITKHLPGTEPVHLDANQMHWDIGATDIVQIDGNRIAGINVGQSELLGTYRARNVQLVVKVVEPMMGMVDIAQRFRIGRDLSIYSGGATREHLNADLRNAAFVEPSSLAQTHDGTIYMADAGMLRSISIAGQVQTLEQLPNHLAVRMVRCIANGVYILSDAWQEETGEYRYGLFKLEQDSVEEIFITDAVFTAIEDFALRSTTEIVFIERNAGSGQTSLREYNYQDHTIQTLCILDGGSSCLALHDRGIFVGNPITGTIQIWDGQSLRNFAGVEGEKAFIDGEAPRFYEPLRMYAMEDALYVWDFNTLRKINMHNGLLIDAESFVGEASPSFSMTIAEGKAEQVILPNSKLADFLVTDTHILLSDPKRAALLIVE